MMMEMPASLEMQAPVKVHDQVFLATMGKGFSNGMSVELKATFIPSKNLEKFGFEKVEYDLSPLTGARASWKEFLGKIYSLLDIMDANDIDETVKTAVKKLGKHSQQAKEQQQEEEEEEKLMARLAVLQQKKQKRASATTSTPLHGASQNATTEDFFPATE